MGEAPGRSEGKNRTKSGWAKDTNVGYGRRNKIIYVYAVDAHSDIEISIFANKPISAAIQLRLVVPPRLDNKSADLLGC